MCEDYQFTVDFSTIENESDASENWAAIHSCWRYWHSDDCQ